MGKMLVAAGVLVALVGLFLWFVAGKGQKGLLPGDIFVEKGNVRFYFPVVTCLVVSLLLTVFFWLLRRK
jgi:hypothetical protein